MSEVKRLFGGFIKKRNPNLNRNSTLKMLDVRKKLFNSNRYRIDWVKFMEDFNKYNQ